MVPRQNLVANIGLEGAHTAAGERGPAAALPTFPLADQPLLHPPLMFPNAAYDGALVKQIIRPPLLSRVRRKAAALQRRSAS